MFINYIKMKGFRSYIQEVTFEFDKGVNVIIGKNGAGKTTSLKALRLLLLDKSDSTLEELVNRDSTYFDISINFEHEGHNYLTTLKYTAKSKQSERTLYIDDMSIPTHNTVSSVKDYLKTILDPDLTYYAIALHQGSSEIIEAKDTARLELFKKIRNIDFSKQVEELKAEFDRLTKDDLVELDVKLAALQSKEYHFTAPIDLPYNQKEVEQLETKVENLILKIGNLKQKEEVEQNISNLQEELAGLSLDTIEAEIKSLQEKIQSLQNKTFDIEESKIKELETYVPKSNSDSIQENFNIQLKELYNKIKNKETELQGITLKRIRSIDFESTKEKMIQNRSQYTTKIKMNEDMIKTLESGTCPTCGKPVTDNDLKIPQVVIKENKELLASNEQAYQQVLEEEKVHKLEIEENEKSKLLKQSLENEVSILNETEIRLKESLNKDLENEKQRILKEQEINNLKLLQAKSDLERDKQNIQKDIEHCNNMIEKNLLQKDELQERISKLEVLIKENKSKLEEFPKESKLDLTIEKELIDKKLSNQKDIIAKNIQIEEMNKKLKDEQSRDDQKKIELMKEKDVLNNKVLNLKEARSILQKHLPNFIISSSIKTIEDSMNDFINLVYDKPLDISLRPTSTSLKLEYGKGKPISCRNLSGAETVLTSLAFIDSLNKELALNFIFLDEADAPLTDSNADKLFEAIQKMGYDQVVIITHGEDFKNKFQSEGAKIFEVGV